MNSHGRRINYSLFEEVECDEFEPEVEFHCCIHDVGIWERCIDCEIELQEEMTETSEKENH